MDELSDYQVIEAKRAQAAFLNACLLEYIDEHLFLSRRAEIETIDSGYDVSTYGVPVDEVEMFTDRASLSELLESPTGDTRKTYDSGRGMAAETHGDRVLKAAEEWCEAWNRDYFPDISSETSGELLDQLGEEGLSTPFDWYGELSGTLEELRERMRSDDLK